MSEEKGNFSRNRKVIVSEEIKDPDKYLEQLIEKLQDFPEEIEILEAVQSGTHEEKVKYLLNLRTDKKPEPGSVDIKMEPATGCIIVIIVTIVTVIIGWEIINGVKRAIKEQQEVEEECEQCPDRD